MEIDDSGLFTTKNKDASVTVTMNSREFAIFAVALNRMVSVYLDSGILDNWRVGKEMMKEVDRFYA